MYSILDNLQNPREIKRMTLKEHRQLAKELRARIAEIVRENGGHLGPNLGAVEIIIACHAVFELDKDRLIFDVGHQSYPHKLLTQRHLDFKTLRKKGGISGYPYQDESPFDVFRSGHASTSISTALGIQAAFEADSNNADRHAISLIGDGSMTGGMAFEGLNHAGHLKNNLIVILNDNSMSISPTVGGLANTLKEVRHNENYHQVREGLVTGLKKIPKLGHKLENMVNYFLEEAKHLVNPSQIFTTLGFEYYGPVDGNDVRAMVHHLRLAKKEKKPVLIHAITKKGKDYMPKGLQGEKLIGPHALSPGQRKKEEVADVRLEAKEKNHSIKLPPANTSYSKAFTEAIIKIAKKNKEIVAVTAAMSEGTGLNEFGKEYPDQFYDVGICEAHAVGFCAGLSSSGKKPIFAVYSTFLQRAFDQLFHDIVLQGNLGLLLCIDRAGLVGDDGPSHHGAYDIAYLRLLPNFILMAPKDKEELNAMMTLALKQKGPTAIRYPREQIPSHDYFETFTGSQVGKASKESLVVGKAELLKTGKPRLLSVKEKTGKVKKLPKVKQYSVETKVCLFAYGYMVKVAVAASEILSGQGLEVAVVNARFAKPVDESMLKKLDKDYDAIVVMEEGTVRGGLGTAVLESFNSLGLGLSGCKVVSCGIPDCLIEHASRQEQLEECGLDEKSIVKLVKKLIGKKK